MRDDDTKARAPRAIALKPLRPDVPPVPRPTSAAEADRLALELFVGGYEPDHLPDDVAALLRDGLAGVTLFARNLRRDHRGEIDTAALAEQTAAIAAAGAEARCGGAPLPTICAVDQEGGLVARLRAPLTRFPAMADVGARDDLALCEAVGAQTGRECLAAGFNVDFAPVLDIDTNPANPIIGSRAFGRDADAVIARAGAFLRGLEREGVRGCGKHFPGHGDTDTDSHLALPRLDFDLERLTAVELRPFAALASELSMIMTAHILFPRLDPEHPATLSRAVLDTLLRGHCGYDGVVVSDDLEMKGVAAAFSIQERVTLGLDAGVDLFLVCRDVALLREGVDAVAERLRDRGPAGLRARRAVARSRALRAGLRRPRPSAEAIARAVADPEGERLRIELGLGNVSMG